jgi:hypothetical protein
VAVVRDEIGLKCVVPLELAFEKLGPVPQNILTFAAEGWALRNGTILALRAASEELKLIAEVVSALSKKGVLWDSCRLSLLHGTTAALVKEKQHTSVYSVMVGECINIGGSVVIETENYFEKVGSKRRCEIKRKTKKLGQVGTVRIERLGMGSEVNISKLDRIIEDALTICKCTWQGESDMGRAICDDDVEAFYRDSCHLLAVRKMLDLSVLYVDNRPVSFIWGHTRRQHAFINKIGFDPEFSQFGVGEVHMAWLIEDSSAQGIHVIDLGHEYTSWKKRWSKREDAIYNAIVYPKGITPFLVRNIRIVKRIIEQ